MEDMTQEQLRNRLSDLLLENAEIEKQMEDKTLPHSDQQLLDQAWEAIQDQILVLTDMIDISEEELDRFNSMEDTRVNIDTYESDFGEYYDPDSEI